MIIRRNKCLLCGELLEPVANSDLQKHPEVETCDVAYTDEWGISIEVEFADPNQPPADDNNEPIFIKTWPYVDGVLGEVFAGFNLPYLGGVSSGRGWSSISKFQRCAYAWKRDYIDRVKPYIAVESPSLAIGSLVHAFLALYYTGMMADSPYRILTPDMVYERIRARANPEFVQEAWRVFTAYRLYYKNEVITPLAVEHDLKDPRTGESCRFDLIAYLDRDLPGLLPGTYIIESKCLPGSTRIYDATLGGYRRVDDLFAKGAAPLILGMNESGALVEAQALQLQANGIKDIYEINLEAGRSIRCSDNHPLFTARGWVPAGALKPGDWVASPARVGRQVDFSKASPLGRFVGFMLGDGHVSSQIGFTQNVGPVLDAFCQTADELGFAYTRSKPTQKRAAVQIRFSVGVGAPVQNLMVRLGLLGHTSGDKFIPEDLKLDEHAPSLIGGLWDTDGCIHIRATDPIISYTTKSRQLACDLQGLLLRLGINSTIARSWATSWSGERNVYAVVKVVGRSSKRLFCEAIVDGRIPSARLKERALEALSVIRPKDNEPVPIELLRERLGQTYKVALHWQDPKRQHIVGMLWRHRAGAAQAVTRATVEEWAESIPELRHALLDVFWDRVETVLIAGKEMVYDLTVPGIHNFVADDLLVHNTAGRFDHATLEGWTNDGEVIGQVALWQKLGLNKRFGPLQGTIINLLGKQNVPRFHRTYVAPDSWRVKSHLDDLARMEGLINLAKSTDSFPRSRGNCINRWGMCPHWSHCAGDA